ncbi:olfactory receptor 1D2-like [Alosa pseudoharengus]|uniref:olfactory receptor 1D2-like n=1 Tax=Alosa pseudoharengus TaxID=34774 RepID=UPI003F8A88F1
MGNISTFKFFILSGLQESGVYKPLYFLLVVVLYILIIIVNLTLIFIVTVDKSLHEPMYIFISNLCANGLYGTVGFYPKILLDLRSDIHMISYSWCMIQTYVIYSSALCEMSILTVMSYDRYVAICRPLQYHSILIPHAVLNDGRKKFSKTCVPHIVVMVIYIMTALFDVFYSWDGSVNLPIGVRNALAIQFLILPPLLNPIIYGLQLPQIRKELRTPKTGSGTGRGEVTVATWQYYEEMHEVLGDRPSVDPPVVVASFYEDPTPILMEIVEPSSAASTSAPQSRPSTSAAMSHPSTSTMDSPPTPSPKKK